MKGRLACGSAVALALVGGHADAAGGVPPFAELPVGHFTAMPMKLPGWVGPRESVRGLHARLDSPEVVTITGEAAAAPRRFASDTCLTEANPTLLQDTPATRKGEWDEKLAGESQAYLKNPNNPLSGVLALHAERFVESNGGAQLEVVDAAIDPSTRGIRTLAKTSFPLKLIHEPGFGLRIFAGRDERPNGKRFIQFVAVRTVSEEVPETAAAWALRLDGDLLHVNGCAHQRVAVPVVPGAGDAAVMVATVVLPPLEARKVADDGKEEAVEVRKRLVNVQVSVSQTAREHDPLVSVSSSWGGRETSARSFLR